MSRTDSLGKVTRISKEAGRRRALILYLIASSTLLPLLVTGWAELGSIALSLIARHSFVSVLKKNGITNRLSVLSLKLSVNRR